jgi:hypothetical protein
MPSPTLRVVGSARRIRWDAERPGRHSHAERGNEGTKRFPAATHEQILDLHLLLFDELFRIAVEGPVRWTR